MASEVLTAEPPAARPGRFRRALLWRSPPGQPAWARPLLLAIATLAGLAYGWGMAGDSVEPFYGAAARSMAGSWHDFIFGAFDPAGTVTVDKLPGALWLQALSIRAFGFHIWALVLPQVLAGVLTVLPVKPPPEDPRVRWIEAHCTTVSVPNPDRAIQFAYYVCDPSAVSG